ncbi:MAG: lysoplasmalogenase family protein [Pseudomonas sp.]
MLNTLLPILLFAALGLAVLGALRRVAMWRRGRASKVDLIGGLLAMPKRYMVDLHHVVARDKYIANTHVATAGGAVAFVFSDSVIGIDRFVAPFHAAPYVIILSYWLGQWGIAASAFSQKHR